MFEFDDIYQTLIGNAENVFAVDWVRPITSPDSGYSLAREEFQCACESLRLRLDAAPCEDTDIETILDSVDRMQQELAYGMFLCGMKYKERLEK